MRLFLPLLILLVTQAWGESLEPLRVEGDDTEIRTSCRVVLGEGVLRDARGDGVVRIVADDVVVDFAGQTLRGAPADAAHDTLSGCGIRITGKRVTVRNAKLSGFKLGIWASGADGLVLEDCELVGNYRQRLHSTPEREDLRDWLRPHDNDRGEWRRRYGSALYVERSTGITVRRCRVRAGQNGLCLQRVSESKIYDNDFSFLSGWGIALYRSSRNVVARNSCDFCIRGYSHGVYSRGQDSAGILMFEQCSENVIAFNSATHSGDGLFGFAGEEALKGKRSPARCGNNRNLIFGNDFSYAAAIGVEMTFSFENTIANNRLVGGNYGIWGGYSSDTRAVGNRIAENTLAGIAIEHGSGWTIRGNAFAQNRRGVELWWDVDKGLLETPWAKLNPTVSQGHRILANTFRDDRVGVELRGGTTDVVLAQNAYAGVPRELAADAKSSVVRAKVAPAPDPDPAQDPRLQELPGERQAVGARAQLRGRARILVTDWGPYDYEAPYLQRTDQDEGDAHRFRLLGTAGLASATLEGEGLRLERDPSAGTCTILPAEEGDVGQVRPYRLTVRSGSGERLTRSGTLLSARWDVRFFRSEGDPRQEPDAWRAAAVNSAVRVITPQLRFDFGHDGPSQLPRAGRALREADLPREGFGTLATTQLRLPAGRWTIETLSDDGLRVWVDDERVIDDWTHHGPTPHTASVTCAEARTVTLRVEHFELGGYSVLQLRVAPAK